MVEWGDEVEGAGRDEERVLEEKMRELEEFYREEFYRRVDRFWAGALKLYVDNVVDVLKLQELFGELHDVVSFSPYFEIELRYFKEMTERSSERVEGVRPTILGYYGVFSLSFVSGVDIDFVDAVVLFTGDSSNKMTGRFDERVEGIAPAWLGYFSVLRLRFAYRVCIEFTDAVALFAGDSIRKRAGYIILDYREARVWRSSDP
ncbi:hypothetical protein TCARB_1843 [Thermofilum adornatum 1505]|uniref:Uncharacterized protein n=1 Tax=Thermofilum adornatum 1505 TaxID=697581 RepID=A0A3G1A7D5_9CREN|nr:hypothetical protein [Thermofilum adornatum]AJB42879.1 hypothetical protein TCARB_1843 [Thermofilum adornatum 1505]